jgi:hypothetical protein
VVHADRADSQTEVLGSWLLPKCGFHRGSTQSAAQHAVAAQSRRREIVVLNSKPLAGPIFVALFPKLTWTVNSNRQVNDRLQDVPITCD